MKTNQKKLKDLKVDIKIILSVLWVVYLFVFIYTDYYKLLIPGVINDMMNGIIEGTKITGLALLTYSIITIIPAVMIFLSIVLSARINKWFNLIFGIVYFLIGMISLTGHIWPFWIFYCSLLILISTIIIIFSWKWPLENQN